MLEEVLSFRLHKRKQQQLYRERQEIAAALEPYVTIDGKQFLNFSSNDYLGLTHHPLIIKAAIDAINEYGFGSGASHLITGHKTPHHQLELQAAEFFGYPRALLFSTGYMANLAILTALFTEDYQVLADKFAHASMVDAGLFAKSKFRRYPHVDLQILEQWLNTTSKLKPVIFTEGVFSMEGDIAPIVDISQLASQYNATLIVDDAHGVGVLGNSGKGVIEHFNLSYKEVPILMVTLGKALGTFGALVLGSEEVIEALIQFARPYVYTTALPPAVAAAASVALKVAATETWRRDKLTTLISKFKQGAAALNLPLLPSITPIQPVILGSGSLTLTVSAKLKQQGILATAIRPPTVPKGKARLRITFSANHEEQHVDALLEALARKF